jgi:DNA polymerase
MSKQKLIDEVVAEVRDCRKCRLWEHAKNPVPGEGNPDAALMLIGEAPGYREDAMGRPFVGRAGKLLDIDRKSVV